MASRTRITKTPRADYAQNRAAEAVSASIKKGPQDLEDQKKEERLVVDERMIPDSALPTDYVEGILDIATEGSGLLRPAFAPSERDIYISASQIRRFNLRVGDRIGGQARRPKENERFWGLLKVEKINESIIPIIKLSAKIRKNYWI